MREPVQLGEVQETLLIPLYGRMLDAQRSDSVLHDTKAIEIVEAIDYDFSRLRGPSLAGSVLRSSIFDQYVRDFLAAHPDGTVVELGTGLNTRFDRLDNGRVRWFDLDLPDTMALRRRFFADTDRYTMIDGSILETDWYDRVRAGGGPLFLISEAVLLYFSGAQVHAALRGLAAGFPATRFAFDTGGRAMMSTQDRNPVFRALAARMTWVCEDPREVRPCGLRLLESRTFASPQPAVARTWPARYRYGLKLLRWVVPPPVTTYKLNLFVTDPPPG